MKLILTYLKRHKGIFLISTFFLTMEAMADLLQPTFMSFIIDKGVENEDIQRILLYGLIMLAIAIVGAVSAVMRNLFSSRTSQTIGKELRKDMYHNVQQLSLENIDRLQPSSIITRMTNDVTQIQEFINSMMRMMVKAPITGIGAIVLIIIQTPKQAPIMIAVLLIVSFLILLNMKIGYPKFGIVQRKIDQLNGVTREFLSSIRVVKAFRAEEEETEKFDTSSKDLARANVSALQVVATFTPLINLTVNFGIVLLLWISKTQDSSQIGRLMASVNYMTQVLFAVTMIANVINTAVRAMASSQRIDEVLKEKPSQRKPLEPLCPEIKGAIVFKHVSFSYANSSKESLKDISFHIPPGKTLGIIGPTGSGKTTLVNLIPRFYDASQGKILIDGCDVTEMDEQWLRNKIAVVAQKALLFSGKISDNLRWGKNDATEEEMHHASELACADSFIMKTEHGYDTWLGQGGVNLSGGQKQRLSLARALIKKPQILILDDCTSALDAQTESEVLKGLGQLEEHMTVLLISQRISTVMRADYILCLDNGKMQGFGTHEELLANCKTYQEIYESQIGGDEDGKSSSAS